MNCVLLQGVNTPPVIFFLHLWYARRVKRLGTVLLNNTFSLRLPDTSATPTFFFIYSFSTMVIQDFIKTGRVESARQKVASTTDARKDQEGEKNTRSPLS